MTSESSLSKALHRKIAPLHKQMDSADVSGGVRPKPEVINRRTGQVQKFGPRRAFDGCYVGEVLAASGCWTEDVATAIWVLSPLDECDCGGMTVKHLLDLLPMVFHEMPTPEQLEQIRKAGEGARCQIRNGELTITRRKSQSCD